MNLKWTTCCFLVSYALFSQEPTPSKFAVGAQYFYGTMLRHNKNIAHLVREHPVGMIASFNVKTSGNKFWHQAYNYPDWGGSLVYQNNMFEPLGENIGIYGHFNFYFFNRKLQLRIAQGIAYNTAPFDLNNNFKNIAYGSHLMASSYLLLQYKSTHLVGPFGWQAGLGFMHHSNGSFKAPNSGTNAVALVVGVYGDFETEKLQQTSTSLNTVDFREPIALNLVLRTGINEGDYFNLGQHPFWVVSAFVDKRLNYKSTIQLGMEFFISEFLKEEIKYVAAAFPGRVNPDTDYKRLALMAGHEFRIGNLGIPTQLGFYIYWPYAYESRVYTRTGVKYYFTDHLFFGATVKSHAANAEAIEFTFGYRI